MRIKKTDSGLLHSCMYVIEENGRAIVIDPCEDTGQAGDLDVDWLIITHEHYDHISGVNRWKEQTGAPLLCSRPCGERIRSSSKNLSRYFDVFCQIQTWTEIDLTDIRTVEYTCEADKVFDDRMLFEWQGHQVELMEIPGHSPGSIGIMIDRSDFFSGDSLMENDRTELRLPGGNARKWEEIGKKRLEALPDGITVHPGHFDSFIYRRTCTDESADRQMKQFVLQKEIDK